MSVVNQMLRDLENNAQSHQPLEMQAVAGKSVNRAWYWLGGLSLLLIAFLLYQFNFPSHFSEAKVSAPESQASATAIAASATQKNQLPVSDEQPSPALQKTPLGETNLSDGLVTDKSKTNATPLKSHDAVKSQDTANVSVANKSTLSPVNQPLETAQVAKPQAESAIQSVEKTATQPGTNQSTTVIKKRPATLTQAQTSKSVIQESKQTRLKKTLQSIQQDSRVQSYNESKDQLLSLLKHNPDFHAARLFLFKLAEQQAEPELARWFTGAIQNFPEVSAYRLGAARYFFERAQWQAAEKTLAEIQPDWSNYDALLQIRGLTRQKMNKHQAAIIDYSAIIRRSPNRGDIYLAMGISFDALGDQVQAKRSFQNALSDRRLSKRQQQFALDKINQYQG